MVYPLRNIRSFVVQCLRFLNKMTLKPMLNHNECPNYFTLSGCLIILILNIVVQIIVVSNNCFTNNTVIVAVLKNPLLFSLNYLKFTSIKIKFAPVIRSLFILGKDYGSNLFFNIYLCTVD